MLDVPTFFVPPFIEAVNDKNQEEMYEDLSIIAQRPIPKQRIYSITFVNDGVECKATVGQQLQNVRLTTTRGQEAERGQSIPDSATVLAIFPGNPYKVVTNRGIVEGIRSHFTNPIMAQPKSVTNFSIPK